jgi:hypothetical protein
LQTKLQTNCATQLGTASTCTTGFYSSETVEGLKKTTDFLKNNEKLKPFDLKVVEPK